MNIGVTVKGQAFDRALAIGSSTRWFRKELVGAAIFAVSCNTLTWTSVIPWDLTSKVIEDDALSS